MIAALAAAADHGECSKHRPFGGYGLPRAAAFGARFWQGAGVGNRDDHRDHLSDPRVRRIFLRRIGAARTGALGLRGALGRGIYFVGFFEEFLFRGYAQFTLATGIGFWPAATALSAAIRRDSLRNGGEDQVGALSVFVIGMFFCLTLRRTGNLWFAVGLHAAFDWGETFLFSVPDSGIVAPGHLLNSSFHGPVWLTGGTVGPEGSVMAFVAVGIAAAIFAVVYPESESP